MNLDIVKNEIKKYLGKNCKFIYKGSRNQIDKFDGIIINCFPSIFVVKTTNGTIKSFSYNDFAMRTIEIICE